MKDYLNKINISGVEELKIDVNKNKPGIQLNIDREKAGELGVSTSQVGQLLRTSYLDQKLVYSKKTEMIMKLMSVSIKKIDSIIMHYKSKYNI